MLSASSLVRLGRSHPAHCLIAAAALILAVEPVRWLVTTWSDPAYDSNGLLVFLAAVGIFAWSLTSPVVDHAPRRRSLAFGLIALSASVRLAGQILAINTVSALCLAFDVDALGLLLGLGSRARLVSPAWLAVVFAFSLPLERIVQRTIGYMLQQVSAAGACGVLEAVYDAVTCEGVRIVLAGKDVLVDLPCSGARALLLTLLAFAGAAAICRPAPLQAAAGLLIALALLHGGNGLVITRTGEGRVEACICAESFEIVATNLIQNSKQADATAIEVKLETSERVSRVSFKDNGIGISEGNRSRIFQPFFTTRREHGGTGLGLRIARSLIEAHQGRIQQISSSHGATFVLTLPKSFTEQWG